MKSKIITLLTFIIILPPSFLYAQNEINVLKVEGVINPITAEYITDGIDKASSRNSVALIIQMDTPGGLDKSMRIIIKKILNSKIPIIVYVAPSGSRAASAGTYITLAAHIAAMAPGTNMGAATPVALGAGKIDEEMKKKIHNDAVAYIKSIAEKRGRNSKWAEEAVRKSVSISETEALKKGVIDLIANDLSELVKKIDKKKVTIDSKIYTINTKDVKIEYFEMEWHQKILAVISDPNIAFLLIILGFYGLFFELSNPGVVFPGLIGAIALILGGYALQLLPINYAGLLLIILAIVMFLLEIKVVSYGALTMGGVVSMVIGSIMLIDSPYPFLRISLKIIIPTTLATAAFFFFLFGAVIRTHQKKAVTGTEGLVGEVGIAQEDIEKGGKVFIHAEIWDAISDMPLKKGEKIKVVKVEGLKLFITKSKEEE
ncbi:MAG TPA: nodulation protein NfeD [Nitrospinota bacterium]|nr:nodulation protein NfeD [Nitrospinota bacterium]